MKVLVGGHFVGSNALDFDSNVRDGCGTELAALASRSIIHSRDFVN